jgi:hypothetical protein
MAGAEESGVTIELDQTFVERGMVLDQVVAEVVAQVHRKTGGPVDVAWVRELVEAQWSRHDDARVRTFLPVLVRRAVVDRMLSA